MKKLVLVRHGKSSWEYSVSDRDRPLKERGINDGLLVSSEFASQNIQIDAAYSSPANRALHTCTIFMRQMGFPLNKLKLTDDLYDFSGDSVLDFIRSLDDSLGSAMIFGHNHAFTHIANSLGNIYIDNVPTTGLVEIDFNLGQWSKVSKGTTAQTIFPKQLKA
jgi:phosphohistidine phosphatase